MLYVYVFEVIHSTSLYRFSLCYIWLYGA